MRVGGDGLNAMREEEEKKKEERRERARKDAGEPAGAEERKGEKD